MFTRSTVFIIGAGASHEAKLPLGGTLMEVIEKKIAMKIDPSGYVTGETEDPAISRAFFKWMGDNSSDAIDELSHASRSLLIALQAYDSIDACLHALSGMPKVVQLGKLAIAAAILEAERESIFQDRNNGPDGLFNMRSELGGTWYPRFLTMLVSGGTASDVERVAGKLKLIVFNYDRCIEHFLVSGLQTAYLLSKEEAERVVCNIEIIHPYGTVGCLPFMDGEPKIEFGANHKNTGFDLNVVATRIRTFTEGVSDHSVGDKARQWLTESRAAVFLGFGFHKQNISLIEPKQKSSVRSVTATAKCISETDRNAIIRIIRARFEETATADRAPVVIDASCANVLATCPIQIMG